ARPVPTPVAAKPVPKEEKVTVAAVRPALDSAKAVERPRSVTLRAPSRVRRIHFVDEPTRSSVIIDLEEPSGFAVERPADHRVSLRLDHADLPDDLARSLDATEYLGPVRLISSYQDPHARGTVRVDVDLAEDVPNRVRQDGSRIYWDFQKTTPSNGQKLPALGGPLPPSVLFVPARRVAGFSVILHDGLVLAQAGSPARKTGEDAPATARRASLSAKKRYVGRRIDLDFKGADIHNILRLLADVGQMNIVTSDEVKGEVTIKMRDVPWDQALDVVLRAKGLGSVREGNLVRVAPLSALEKELEQEIARQKQMAEVLPTETRLIGVSYASASALSDKAKDLLSPRGKISVDDRTNNLIVSDVARNLQLIEDLVRNLDTQTSQVVIEARIVEANTDYSRQIGIQWGGNTFMDVAHGNPTGLVFPYNVGIGGGADGTGSPLGGLVPGVRTGVPGGSNPNFVVNMPAPAGLATGSALGLTLGSVAGAFNLNLRLSAMESTGTVRILSSPRITTMDNIDATIEQGVSIPVAVVSAAGAQTQFVDAKLHLNVKPHVTNEGTVMLTVTVTKNEPDFVNTGARGDPTILKKQANTTMLVRDGDTAVIGGIYTRNSGLSFTKVPFFSDIPVLGWFFRSRKENDNRTEFLVFLTPRIVNRARALGQ
ncbi:MAG TPA: type IV pilus secretin PilQ, partial [Polyangia bacterium]|nr:type IV pilus secretin PilQ [Polyangia bacterium]